ncbi:MAG: IclR family transcriptional regulator [Acidimicrobiales bacterium]
MLDALERGPLSLRGLVEATGLSRATAHRLASALEVHGFVGRAGDGRFQRGPRLATPALADLARPAMERLRDATGESVQLYVRRGDQRVCVAALESPHGLRTIVAVGAFLPLDQGSGGRVLRDGVEVAESIEERQRGVASVSASVRDGAGATVAAVSVSGPIERTTRQPGRRYTAAVTAAASEIAEALAGA